MSVTDIVRIYQKFDGVCDELGCKERIQLSGETKKHGRQKEDGLQRLNNE